MIYLGSYRPDGVSLSSISPEGQVRWSTPLGLRTVASASVGTAGDIYLGTSDGAGLGTLYSISPQGNTNWMTNVSGNYLSSCAIANDGTIYVIVQNTVSPSPVTPFQFSVSCYAVSPSGIVEWVLKFADFTSDRETGGIGNLFSSPSIGPDGTIYAASVAGQLAAISGAGTMKWKFDMHAGVTSCPAIGSDGSVYVSTGFPSYDNGAEAFLYAFRTDGTPKWRFKIDSPTESSPVIDSNGKIYVCSGKGTVYALTDEGEQLWSTSVYQPIAATPAVDLAGTIYCAGIVDIQSIDLTGNPGYKFALGQFFASPALTDTGQLYFTGGLLYSTYVTNAVSQGSWPMFGMNAAHTARSFQRGIEAVGIRNAQISMRLSLEPDQTYSMEASTDFREWAEVRRIESTNSPNPVFDLPADSFPGRFFRLRCIQK